MQTFIENLQEWQRAGLDFINEEKDEKRVKTETGVESVIVRRIENSYTLKLQDLTKNQVKEVRDIIRNKELTRPNDRITIPVNLFEGYVGDAQIQQDFNFDSKDLKWEREEEVYEISLKVTEIILP